jgi:processive 1,2-diacylglycerol beta-glucosyltransferase
VKYKNDIRALGFVDDMAELFAPADLVVSKAGGISVMELITCKKPIVITEINPGQEEPNARFIESMGFGYVEKKAKGLAEKVKYIFEYNDIERLKNNLNNYHLNDHSDERIADYIYDLVTQEKQAKKPEHEGYFQRIIHHLK